MPRISKSASSIPASAIRMLTPFADKAKADGVKIYHLNIGAPDIKSPVSAVKALKEFSFDHLPYTNSAGTLELRKALVEKYYRHAGINIGIDDILVTTAGSESLTFIFHAAFDPGDEVLVMEPLGKYIYVHGGERTAKLYQDGVYTEFFDACRSGAIDDALLEGINDVMHFALKAEPAEPSELATDAPQNISQETVSAEETVPVEEPTSAEAVAAPENETTAPQATPDSASPDSAGKTGGTPNEKKSSPKTGDNGMLFVGISLIAAGFLAGGCLCLKKRIR